MLTKHSAKWFKIGKRNHIMVRVDEWSKRVVARTFVSREYQDRSNFVSAPTR